MHNDKVLHQILTKARQTMSKGSKSLAVFDLDSTLFDVSPRLKHILVEISASKEFRSRFAPELALFKSLDIDPRDWGLGDVLRRKSFVNPSPDFFEDVRRFWRLHFFSNAALDYDIPYSGSIQYVQALHEAGVDLVYLTGRDVHRMGPGTLKVLQKWHFPTGDRAQLVLKPDRAIEDGFFKTDWFIKQPLEKYQNVWFFENEPVNVNALRKSAVEVHVVFFDSTHSRNETAPKDLDYIKHFLFDREET